MYFVYVLLFQHYFDLFNSLAWLYRLPLKRRTEMYRGEATGHDGVGTRWRPRLYPSLYCFDKQEQEVKYLLLNTVIIS